MKIAIIGGGITGLTAALRLLEKSHQVTIFEKEDCLGGLAAGFKKKSWDWTLENFFHHLFISDEEAKKLIQELGLGQFLLYLRPKTSIFYQGKIAQFDDFFSVLRFPGLTFLEKIRAGLVTFYLKLVSNWQKFSSITAQNWLKKYYGQKIYRVLWEPLLKSKFGDYAPKVSMVWFWARIKKRSRRLGYLKGGFTLLIERLAQEIRALGGKIYLNQEIKSPQKIIEQFDKIIFTTPTPAFLKTKLPPMLGALNLILALKEQFLTDGTYWLNVNEAGFPFVAVVEQTNLVDSRHYGGNRILYVGGYYPQSHRYFKLTVKEVLSEFWPYLKKINPKFSRRSVIESQLAINFYAQPLVTVNYESLIPRLKTNIPKVLLANMQMVYPYDRGMNYAIEMGEKVAKIITNNE
jgi:protoporphyrinogen oxidase